MTNEEVVIRSQSSYQAYNQRFATYPPTLTESHTQTNTQTQQQQQQPYNRQYSSVYTARLTALKPKCLSTFHRRNKETSTDSTDSTIIVPRLIELKEDTSSFIIGTIIKHCPKKPKINFDTNQNLDDAVSYLGTPYDSIHHDTNDNDDNNDDDSINVEPSLANTTFCNITNDTIVLEDESGRVELDFTSNSSSKCRQQWKLDVVTGVIVGVKGKIQFGTTLFVVEDIYYPTLGPRRTSDDTNDDDDNVNDANDANDDKACILLMSGLDCGGYDKKRNSSTSLKRELLIDYITGQFGTDVDSTKSELISRIIIAGGGCTKPIRPKNYVANSWSTSTTTTSTATATDTNLNKKEKAETLKQQMKETTIPIRELDLFLNEICANGIPIDYIPGLYDPTNGNWPQRPIHECLVPNANVYLNMLHRTTNPYECCVGGRFLLGSDGVNIFDLRCYLGQIKDDDVDVDGIGIGKDDMDTDKEKEIVPVSTIDALQSSLKFNHLVPTGPDSVPTFPFDTNDPFVIEYTPHVYFCGNCDSFDTKLVDIDIDDGNDDESTYTTTKVRLICIPSFVKTGQVVLMNLKSLECNIIEFDDVVVDGDEKKME